MRGSSAAISALILPNDTTTRCPTKIDVMPVSSAALPWKRSTSLYSPELMACRPTNARPMPAHEGRFRIVEMNFAAGEFGRVQKAQLDDQRYIAEAGFWTRIERESLRAGKREVDQRQVHLEVEIFVGAVTARQLGSKA